MAGYDVGEFAKQVQHTAAYSNILEHAAAHRNILTSMTGNDGGEFAK